MKLNRNQVYHSLHTIQQQLGGYNGTHISALADEMGVSSRALRKRIESWRKSDEHFSDLQYIGKQTLRLTLDEYSVIQKRIEQNPLILKSNIWYELNKMREHRGQRVIPERSFYRVLNSQYPHIDQTNTRKWFNSNNVSLNDEYSIQE